MIDELRFYWRLILRRLPLMTLIVILCTIGGIVQAIRLPATYQTEARLLVESQQIDTDLADTTVAVAADEEIQIIREQLLTRANMLDIATEFDVFEDRSEISPDRIVERMSQSTQIQNRGGRNQATVITVAFSARSGQIAADVVNEYVTRIINASVELRTGRAGDTLAFFERQVEELSAELDTRSARISQFQAENADALPDSQEFRLGRQAVLQERIGSATRELSALIDQRARIIEIYDLTGRIDNSGDILSDDERQLRDLERELAQQLTIYSETAPNIVILRSRIDQLRGQIASTGPSGPQVSSSQAILDSQLLQIDGQIEDLEGIITEAEQELTRLDDQIARTPGNAITLAGLQRDYDNIRVQFDTAVARLAEAEVGERLELDGRGQRIRLIEAANVPAQPSSPNRRLIVAMGGAAGIGLAGALFLLLELLNRTVRRPVEISRALNFEPLVTVPYIETRQERFRRISIRVAVMVLMVGGVPAAALAVNNFVMPLDQLANTILDQIGLS